MRSPDIDTPFREVKEGLGRGPVQVVGGLGSGRHTLAHRLRQDLNAIVVDVLSPLETDASAALWLEAGVSVGFREKPKRSSREDMEAHGRSLASALSDGGRTLVLILPEGRWGDEHTGVLRQRALSLLTGLRQHQSRVEIGSESDRAVPWAGRVFLAAQATAMGTAHAKFGVYEKHAAELAASLGDEQVGPLVARLAVGAVAWGLPAVEAAHHCRAPASVSLPALLDALSERIEPAAVRSALRRLAMLRRDFARDAAGSLTGIPEEHLPLITDVLGYGDELIRVSAPVRDWLKRLASEPDAGDDALHGQLAAHYRAADGVLDPFEITDAPQMVAWIEKSHHLAYGGSACVDEWRRQKHVDPWLFWARARALSLSRNYGAAVEAYREGLRVFADDDYGWHYLGFNLDRDRGSDSEVERAYRKAVELAPTMPWWQSRLVCWLIHHHQPTLARAAWAEALRVIDPDGSQSRRLAPSCGHVAAAWCDEGRAGDARAALVPARHDLDALQPRHAALQERLAADKSRFEAFFAALENKTSALKAAALRDLWSAFRRRAGNKLPDPVVTLMGPTESDALELSLPDWLLTIDVTPEGHFDWFARQRGTDDAASGDGLGSVATLMEEVGPWLDRICG